MGNKVDVDVCLKKLELVGNISMATVDETGMPRDRIISTLLFEGRKIFFYTARGKHFYKELVETKKVSMLAYTKFNEQIRLNGEVNLVEQDKQREYIDKIFEKYPYLYNVYPEKTNEIGAIFVVENAEIEYFDLKVPVYREYFSIGNYEPKKVGFVITEKCIKCGTCFRNCPQKAIEQKEFGYKIRQYNCLHCGNCFEKCPVKAITRIEDMD